MARQREFDVDETAARALELFWRNGYAATSVRELVEHTGVAHAGLYAAFGDKDGVFTAALERYAGDWLERLFAPLERKGAGREEIETLFADLVRGSRKAPLHHGCFVANAAIDTSIPEGARATVRRCLERERRAFEHALKGARAAGTVSASVSPGDRATMLLAGFQGLSTLVRAGEGPALVRRASRTLLASLDA